MFVNFSEIPGLNNLFLDYLYEFQNVEKYFIRNFRDENHYPLLFSELTTRGNPFGETIAKSVKRNYGGKALSKLTEENIKNLKANNSLILLTEVPLTIFGGTLVILNKIITLLKLVNSLKEKFPSYNFIPVAYLLTEENNFRDSSSVGIFSEDFTPVSVKYDDGLEEEENRGRIGELVLKDSIANSLNELKSHLKELEFADYGLELSSHFQSGNTFAEGMKKFLFDLFDKYGLVLFEPNSPEIKKLLSGIYSEELKNFEAHSVDAVFRSADIEEFYEPVVKVRPLNLKMSYGKGLYSIIPDENIFKLKRKRRSFTKEELLQLIESEPARFTPTTMLRAVSQSHIFPLAFVVADAFEISSFAQIFSLYKFFDYPLPVIYPSASLTFSEFELETTLGKFNISATEFFAGGEILKEKIKNNLNDSYVGDIFKGTDEKITLTFKLLKEKLSEFEPSLSEEAGKILRNTLTDLNRLKDYTLKSREKDFGKTFSEIEKIRKFIFPNEFLQEYEIAAIYFLSKYGEDTIPWLFNRLSINDFRHLIAEI